MENNFGAVVEIKSIAKIENNFVEIGASIDKKILSLNPEGQVVTADTKQAVKKMKSEWNKSFEPVEAAFKAAISEVEAPIKEIKALFKEHVTDKKAIAYNILSEKVKQFEDSEKTEKETVLRDYFDRCQEKYGFDFVKLENCIQLPVLLSTTEKNYKEQILQKFEQVESDLSLIETQGYAAEILVEYKKTLNCSVAIVTVTQRKEAEKLEIVNRMKETIRQRQQQLINLNFTWIDSEKCYKSGLLQKSVTQEQIEASDIDTWFSIFQPLYHEFTEKSKAVISDAQTPQKQAEMPENYEWKFEMKLTATRASAEQFIGEFRALREKHGVTIKKL